MRDALLGRQGVLQFSAQVAHQPERWATCAWSSGTLLGVGLTDDRSDPRLTHGVNDEPVPQAEVYLVLSDEERAKGFVRPVRRSYRHETCNAVTTMGQALAETYARDPSFYGATYCAHCQMHRRVGANGEFVWVDGGEKVGT